ncbi:hypothetical protein L596_008296 [Steinernema carpocapsae]|uniref:Amidase domain-containing protein n=1 Tax=Steinernema carpocapsae TaxID=34508 RepID=A0A4U5PD49_STECR|nr:hypothetical protein L596_008296 [Steinernema carpocapsae]
MAKWWPIVERLLFFISYYLYFPSVNFVFWLYHSILTRKQCVYAPDSNSLLTVSATQASEMIRNRVIRCVDIIEAYIDRIEKVNEAINAVVVKNFEEARKQARQVDDYLDRLDKNSDEYKNLATTKPLLGVPFTLKDCIEVEGLVCTAGISCRRDVVSEKDAEVVKRVKNSGAIVLAVTNVPEVCMWWESVNSVYGRSKNPYDTRRITGGSSGGEGALLAAAGSVIGIGSDIGGSIRMPAYFNGVFGLKPTPGVVPLEGHLPEAVGYRERMLRIGPMCRYAKDLQIMLKIFAGEEAENQLQLSRPISVRNLRIFYMEGIHHFLTESLHEDCKWALKRAVQYFEKKYDLVAYRLDLPLAHNANEYFVTSMDVDGAPSFAKHLADLKGEVNCLAEIPKLVMGKSNHTLPALILGVVDQQKPFSEKKAQILRNLRDRLQRQLMELLQDDGILLFPSFPTVAPFHHQPLLTPFNFSYTALWNTLALPVVQCPMGLNDDGVPVGVQAIGSPNADRLLISVANDLEEGFGGWKPLRNPHQTANHAH